MIDVEPLAAGHVEAAAVEAEQVQDRRVDVGDVVRRLDRVEAEFVGRAVDDAALDAGAGEPDREAVRVVVAAGRHLVGVARFQAGRAAELGGSRRPARPCRAPSLQVLESPAIGLSTRAHDCGRAGS